MDVTVVMGQLGEVSSPARIYTPLLLADAAIEAGAAATVPLCSDFEYAVLTLVGSVQVDDVDPVTLQPGPLLFLGAGRSSLSIRSQESSRLLLIGGQPSEERLVMWWNFVGRNHRDIVTARENWQAGTGFGEVVGFDGDRLPDPALPGTRLRPRGRIR